MSFSRTCIPFKVLARVARLRLEILLHRLSNMLLKYNNLRFATLKYRVPLFYFFLLRPRRFSSSFALLPLHIKPRRIDLRFVTFLAPFYGRGMLLKFIRLFATSLSLFLARSLP